LTRRPSKVYLIDFSRHGSGTEIIRRLVPFLNAHLQGLDKARRTLFTPLSKAARGELLTEADVTALKNAGASWGLIGISSALGFAYGVWNSGHEAYRDSDSLVRASHLIVPGGAFGMDGKILVIPKPFELAMGFNLGEMLALQVMTGDPRVAGFAAHGVAEVMTPPNVLNSIPIVKTYAEVALNKSFFTGRDIVPENLQSLPAEEQYTERTTPLAKGIGRALGVSPIKVEHTIGSTFGTWGRDLLAASNPADPDAPAPPTDDTVFLRRFIKGEHRASETTKTFWKIAATQNGEFAQAKNQYDRQVKFFNDTAAQAYLAALPTPKRAYTILHSAADEEGDPVFSADDKRIHPLTRGADAVGVINGLLRELQQDAQRATETGERVRMDPQKRRQAIDNLRTLAAMEQRNALVIAGEPGYQGRKLLSTEDQWRTLQAVTPKVASEIASRYASAKILPTEAVAKAWPEAQRRLLSEGSNADISDLSFDAEIDGYAFDAERESKPKKRRIPIAGQASATR
jgi:hypothetical protein